MMRMRNEFQLGTGIHTYSIMQEKKRTIEEKSKSKPEGGNISE